MTSPDYVEKDDADEIKVSPPPDRKRASRRSRSRSPRRRSNSVGRSPKRSRSRSRTYSPSGIEETRVHVANIDETISEQDLEDAFGRFGSVGEIWLATYSPYYSFIVFKSRTEAEDAVRYLNNTYLRNCKLRVSVALPRRRRGDRPPPRYSAPAPRYNDQRSGGGGGGRGYDRYGGGGGGGRGYDRSSGGGGGRDYYSSSNNRSRGGRSDR